MKMFEWMFVIFLTCTCALSVQAQKQVKYLLQTSKNTKSVPYVINPKLPLSVRKLFVQPVTPPSLSVSVERQLAEKLKTAPSTQKGRKIYPIGCTAQKWLEIVEPWVLEHQRWPSANAAEEKIMYMGAYGAIFKNPKDPASIRLKELREMYPLYRTPQVWLEMIESWVQEHQRWPSANVKGEKVLYFGAYRAVLSHPEDPASRRLKELKKKYAVQKTPQEWLEVIEPWVLEHQRWPSQKIAEEKSMYVGVQKLLRYRQEDPSVVRLKELKEQWSKERRAPQEWLEIVEPWVLEHQRWPSANVEEERALYFGADGAIRHHLHDPASVRLKELKEQFLVR